MGKSENTLAFRTWELLYIKEISRVVDELPTEKPLATEVVKRLVRSFLPRFPDECRLCHLEAMPAYWIHREQGEDDDTLPLIIQDIVGSPYTTEPNGDSIWVYIKNEPEDFSEYLLENLVENLGDTGITKVEILNDSGCGWSVPVRIRDFVPFERLFEYFENEVLDEGELNVSSFAAWSPLDEDEEQVFRARIWRKLDNTAVRIISSYLLRPTTSHRFFRQLNGTWAYGYCRCDRFGWGQQNVGTGFISEERVENILKSLTDHGVTIEEYE